MGKPRMITAFGGGEGDVKTGVATFTLETDGGLLKLGVPVSGLAALIDSFAKMHPCLPDGTPLGPEIGLRAWRLEQLASDPEVTVLALDLPHGGCLRFPLSPRVTGELGAALSEAAAHGDASPPPRTVN